MNHAASERRPERGLSGAGGPQPPSDFRDADARRSGREGSHRALRHLAAGGVATPRHAEEGRARARQARGTLHLLPRASEWDETSHRLDRALPRLLDGARGEARTATGDNGRVTVTEKTAAGQT